MIKISSFSCSVFLQFSEGRKFRFGRKFRPSGSSGQISGQSSGRVQNRFLVAFLGVRKFPARSSGPGTGSSGLSEPATAISVGGAINTPPLLQPWATRFSLLSPPLLTLESLPPLNSSHNSCISLSDLRDEI